MSETKIEYYHIKSKAAQKALRKAFKAKNKYNAKKAFQKFSRGRNISFDSKAEREHALWLESQRISGRIKDWKSAKEMPSYKMIIAGKLITSHKVDFTVWNVDGTTEVHEVKSEATASEGWKIRRKLWPICYPEIKYKTFWFGRYGRYNAATGRVDIDYDQ